MGNVWRQRLRLPRRFAPLRLERLRPSQRVARLREREERTTLASRHRRLRRRPGKERRPRQTCPWPISRWRMGPWFAPPRSLAARRELLSGRVRRGRRTRRHPRRGAISRSRAAQSRGALLGAGALGRAERIGAAQSRRLFNAVIRRPVQRVGTLALRLGMCSLWTYARPMQDRSDIFFDRAGS